MDFAGDAIPPGVLAAWPADCQPIRSAQHRQGGFSDARIWKCTAPRGALALRAWPTEIDRERLLWIHRFQLHIAATGRVTVAAPIATRDHATIVDCGGRFWELAPWLAGEPLRSGETTDAERRAALVALADFHLAAAQFASNEPREGAPPAALRRRVHLQNLIQTNCRIWPARLESRGWPELAPLAHRWISHLPRMIPLIDRALRDASGMKVPLQACLRDIWSEHLLFQGSRVTGILDFGAAGWDTVAGDLARLIPSLVGDDLKLRQELLASYESLRPLAPVERLLIDLLDQAAVLLGPALWFRWIAEEGREFSNRDEVVRRVAAMVERLDRLARGSMDGGICEIC